MILVVPLHQRPRQFQVGLKRLDVSDGVHATHAQLFPRVMGFVSELMSRATSRSLAVPRLC